jgi:hypothetical protein
MSALAVDYTFCQYYSSDASSVSATGNENIYVQHNTKAYDKKNKVQFHSPRPIP